jgi:hypothetical protein
MAGMGQSSEYEQWGVGDGAWAPTEAHNEADPYATDEEDDDEMTYYDDEDQRGGFGIFLTGLAIGLAIGAGAALLYAPQPGEVTRRTLGKQAKRFRGDVSERWEDLRDELDAVARRGRKRVRRGIERGRWGAKRGRWQAEDLVERGRRIVS